MRIIAGKHKGLILSSFEADNIRPTIDRVRENIFNKIQFDIPGACVLDLFGGTGAISLEFLSRGASRVVTVDNNINSLNLISKNFAKAHEIGEIIKDDFKSALKNLSGQKFDFIFLDPPFASGFGSEAILLISKYNLLEDNGLIIFEHSLDIKPEFDDFELNDYKKYGTIAVSYFKRKING